MGWLSKDSGGKGSFRLENDDSKGGQIDFHPVRETQSGAQVVQIALPQQHKEKAKSRHAPGNINLST